MVPVCARVCARVGCAHARVRLQCACVCALFEQVCTCACMTLRGVCNAIGLVAEGREVLTTPVWRVKGLALVEVGEPAADTVLPGGACPVQVRTGQSIDFLRKHDDPHDHCLALHFLSLHQCGVVPQSGRSGNSRGVALRCRRRVTDGWVVGGGAMCMLLPRRLPLKGPPWPEAVLG